MTTTNKQIENFIIKTDTSLPAYVKVCVLARARYENRFEAIAAIVDICFSDVFKYKIQIKEDGSWETLNKTFLYDVKFTM